MEMDGFGWYLESHRVELFIVAGKGGIGKDRLFQNFVFKIEIVIFISMPRFTLSSLHCHKQRKKDRKRERKDLFRRAFFAHNRNLVVLCCIWLKVVPEDDELNNLNIHKIERIAPPVTKHYFMLLIRKARLYNCPPLEMGSCILG